MGEVTAQEQELFGAPPREHHVVTRQEATAIVQQLLRAHGHRTVPVDGEHGTATAEALLHFQQHHGLPATGQLSRDTVIALRRRPRGMAAPPHHDDPAPPHHDAAPAHHDDPPPPHHDAAPTHHDPAPPHHDSPPPHRPTPAPHPHPAPSPSPHHHAHRVPASPARHRGGVGSFALTAHQRQVAREIVAKGCALLLAHRAQVHYSEGPNRWQGIDRKLRIAKGQFLTEGDCSSTATWLLWNAFTHFHPDMPDVVNGEHWRAGTTWTMQAHGTLVRNPSQVMVGDLILYAPVPKFPFAHVSVALGGGQCFSHGSEAGPFKLPAAYRPIQMVRRYI